MKTFALALMASVAMSKDFARELEHLAEDIVEFFEEFPENAERFQREIAEEIECFWNHLEPATECRKDWRDRALDECWQQDGYYTWDWDLDECVWDWRAE